MQLNFVALLGFAATALGRALPYNVSTAGVGDGDYIVQTAGDFNPNNLASDGIWDKYQKKGDHYQCLFEANDEGAGRLVEDTRTPPSAASVWKGSQYYERAIWNWHDTNYFDEDNCNFEYLHLKDAFDALSLNAYCEDEGGHNVGWNIGHYDESRNDGSNPGGFQQMLPVTQQTYVVDGKTYKSTGGYYTFVVNQVDGAIIALDISSPQNAVNSHWKSILNGGKANDEDLPKLRYMSDLVWGKWVDGNKDVRNLRVYAVNNVLNDETTAIVSRALHNKGVSSLSAWPGTVFDKVNDPEEFQALIGSPIGGTMSILLAQHKAELGNKEIYQVNVVSDKNTLEPFQVTEMHMFFQIWDVPPSNPKEEQKA